MMSAPLAVGTIENAPRRSRESEQLVKRSPLTRKTPLRSRTAKPKTVHRERTAHLGRMKRKATDMNALEEKHVARIRKLPCLVTGKRPVEPHHLMKAPGKRCRRDHRWVVPLHYTMHRGPEGVHGLGTEAKFEEHHKLAPGFLIAWAKAEWEKTVAAN